jgi:hypothetical protein
MVSCIYACQSRVYKPFAADTGSLDSPLFSKRPQFGQERLCRPVLTTEVPKLVGNRRWLNVLADKCITLDSVQVDLGAG